MTTVNANVVASKVLVKDANGEALATVEDLNLLGVPSVSISLGGKVNTADVVASAITAAKLADAVADMLRTVVATVGDEATDDVTVTLQMQDAQGHTLGDRCVLVYWLSDALYGAPTGTLPDSGVSVTTGTEIVGLAASLVSRVATDSDGVAVLVFTEAGALTRYFNVVVLNDLVVGSQVLTWEA